MLPVTWGPFANVHGDVKNRTAYDAHQFALGGRRFLKMQTAHGTFSRRNSLIVLNKSYICDLLAEPTINPDFRKESPRIGESPWDKKL